jgi:hypothetical protein
MAVRGVEQVGERPLEELLQNASQEAVALAPGSRGWAEVPFLLRSLREPARRR